MKHYYRFFLFAALLFWANSAAAVFVSNMPVCRVQPNGDTVRFFVTGDEFYHRFHDADNFTVVQNSAGFWVYAAAGKDGAVTPTGFLVNSVSPAGVGLVPGVSISQEEYQKRRRQWDIPEQFRHSLPKTSGRNHGDFCNLVIFIRFADDSAYSRSLESVDRMFSDSSRHNSSSVYNYFKHASYNKIFVRTYYAPTPDGNTIRSYRAPHPRAFYMPYNDDNPIGYTTYSDRTQREFDLLAGAVNWINDSAPVPASYNLDCDDDGFVDNVNFVVKGSFTGWNDLLWPHKWNLYGQEVYINGKRVNVFNFALEGAGSDYFGSSTFCHEMFHSFGAPDLYHYGNTVSGTPVGSWDLMASNAKPPQHSLAWIKYKYGNWLDSIPTVTEPGTYTLRSVADSVPGTMALKFPSAHPDQFYVVEYRDNSETFETTLPGKGLLIYRVDTRFDGNAAYDGAGNYNEVWIFRPDAGSDDENGRLAEAYFSPLRHRTEFSPSSNPFPYLSDGTRDMSFAITDISTPGSTCSFRYTNRTTPADLAAERVTSISATLAWKGVGDAYRVCYRPLGSTEEFRQKLVRANRTTVAGLDPNTSYEWTVRALYDRSGTDNYADSSRTAAAQSFHTELCNNPHTDTVGWYTTDENSKIPFAYNENYNYSQQIFRADELHGEKDISTLYFHYAYTAGPDKANCTVYLGNTALRAFNDSVRSVPFDQLTPVYAGPLQFSRGWNMLTLDTPFRYNGSDNLVVAIDDNSGTPSRVGHKFFVHATDDWMACNYSGSANPDPAQDSIPGSYSRHLFRNNIKFTGCPVSPDKAYACVISDNDEQGTVSGEGLYALNETITVQAFPNDGFSFARWSDGSTDNPRQLALTSDTILIAYFHSPLSVDNPRPAHYTVTTGPLAVTVAGAAGRPVALYDLMGRPVAAAGGSHDDPATLRVPAQGIYLLRVGFDRPVKLLVKGQ